MINKKLCSLILFFSFVVSIHGIVEAKSINIVSVGTVVKNEKEGIILLELEDVSQEDNPGLIRYQNFDVADKSAVGQRLQLRKKNDGEIGVQTGVKMENINDVFRLVKHDGIFRKEDTGQGHRATSEEGLISNATRYMMHPVGTSVKEKNNNENVPPLIWYTTTSLKGKGPRYWRLYKDNPYHIPLRKVDGCDEQGRPYQSVLFQDFTNGNYSNYVGLGHKSLGDTTSLYFSGWFYMKMKDESLPSRNVKMISMQTKTKWQTRWDVYPINGSGHLYAGVAKNGKDGKKKHYVQDWSATSKKAAIPFKGSNHNKWHRLEGWLNMIDARGMGYRDVSIDLKRVGKIEGKFVGDENKNNPEFTNIHRLFVGHFFSSKTNQPGKKAEAIRYWDEIYISKSRTRIELGDDPIWENCKHREIQIPVLHDSEKKLIGIKLNLGSFFKKDDNVLNLFLFFVNHAGEPSKGFPVRIEVSPAGP